MKIGNRCASLTEPPQSPAPFAGKTKPGHSFSPWHYPYRISWRSTKACLGGSRKRIEPVPCTGYDDGAPTSVPLDRNQPNPPDTAIQMSRICWTIDVGVLSTVLVGQISVRSVPCVNHRSGESCPCLIKKPINDTDGVWNSHFFNKP